MWPQILWSAPLSSHQPMCFPSLITVVQTGYAVQKQRRLIVVGGEVKYVYTENEQDALSKEDKQKVTESQTPNLCVFLYVRMSDIESLPNSISPAQLLLGLKANFVADPQGCVVHKRP